MMRSTTSLEDDDTQRPRSDSLFSSLPPTYSLFGGHIAADEKQTTTAPENSFLKFDDEDCDRINYLDYRFFNYLYDKDEVNKLLKNVLEKNNYTLTKAMTHGFTTIYSVYTHTDTRRTVALFSVVKDREDKIFLKDNYIWSLDEALRAHRNNHEFNDLIIVPMLETILPHYRLITLDLPNNAALYHDSKSPVTSASVELSRALVSAATKEFAPSLNSDRHPALLPTFADSYFYVGTSCGRYFYNIPVVENCLNHQAFYNRIDSGAYVVAYAELFLQNVDLKQPIAVDINAIKEAHFNTLYPPPTLVAEANSEPARLAF